MVTFMFKSQGSEVLITVVAADVERAEKELYLRLDQLQQTGIQITTYKFDLISAY